MKLKWILQRVDDVVGGICMSRFEIIILGPVHLLCHRLQSLNKETKVENNLGDFVELLSRK